MWNHQDKKKLIQLPPDTIHPNPAQPRTSFDPDSLSELADSIRQNGLLQPLTVRRTPTGEYQLIAGERRLRACKLAGLSLVSCVVSSCDSRQSAILAMLENLQRRDLGVFEEAEGLRRLVEEWGVTQEEAAARLGKSQSSIANKLRLLRLSSEEREIITRAGLTERHARAVLRLEKQEDRLAALKWVEEQQLNVAQTEAYIAQLIEPAPKAEKGQKKKKTVLVRDVRLFMNTIHHAVDVMKQSGIGAQSWKRETEEYLEYVVRIPRSEASGSAPLSLVKGEGKKAAQG